MTHREKDICRTPTMHEPIRSRQRLDVHEIVRRNRGSGSPWSNAQIGKWALAASVLLIFIVGAWLGSNSDSILYRSETIALGNLAVNVTATGSVQPTKKVDISSELSGTVRSVLVDYNSAVTVGQILAELDTDKLNAAVESSRAKLIAAKAKVAETQATVAEKERDLARKQRLAGTQAIATQELDQAQAAFDRAVASRDSARADVGVAGAQLRIDETSFDKAFIRSPIRGVILKRNIDPGQIVASTLQAPVLFSIAEDLTQMELQVDIDEADVGKVKTEQLATFSVDAFPDRRFPATIRDIRYASETIQGVVTYKALLNIDNSELLLRPGMTATSVIAVARVENALLIPNAALRYAPRALESAPEQGFLRRLLPGPPAFRPPASREETGSRRSVWVLRDGKPAKGSIEIGLSDGNRTEVKGGDVRAGDAVIVDQSVPK